MTAAIDGFGLMTRDAARLAAFYRAALDFSPDRDVDDAIRLGAQRVVLHHAEGAAYPVPRESNDPWFQHLAIVVRDIEAAYRQAMAHGAVAISAGGPQRLPQSSGGVSAWKFRDPEGHPLELLEFPAGQAPDYWRARPDGRFLGIDHSAIVVEDTGRSLSFYRGLGFAQTAQSHNVGPAQAALDGLGGPNVLVTALSLPGQAAPHLELLEYFAPVSGRPDGRWAVQDIVATRIVLGQGDLRRDPDGHVIAGAP